MNIRKFTKVAMFAALAAVLTMFPQIATPTGGYVHFGDSIIYIAAAFSGSAAGALVGAIGHAMADVLTGHLIFALPTFIIKGLMGFVIGKILYNKTDIKHLIIAGACALIIVTLGYFVAESIMFGVAAAMTTLVSSPVQWLMSVIATAFLMPIIKRVMKK